MSSTPERQRPQDDNLPSGEEAARQGAAPLPPVGRRARQDTQPVEGETATNLPSETDLIQKPKVQG